MSLLNKVIVFSDEIQAYEELCSGARILGNEVNAAVIGTKEDAEKIAAYGVKVYWLGEKAADVMVEDYTQAIAELVKKEEANLLLMKGTRKGRLMAGRLGVILEAGVVPDAIELQVEDGKGLLVKRLAYGGTAIKTEKPVTAKAIVLTGSGVFPISGSVAQGEVVTVGDAPVKSKITLLETREKEGTSVDIGIAKRVVSVGRGFAKEEDLELAKELAKKIGAEMTCSRPIAEGEKWMETGRYIGVSGAMIKPDVYIAIGISGQIQHMVGVNSAKTIIAINKDKNAPIFQYADFGIVGDLYKVLPLLAENITN